MDDLMHAMQPEVARTLFTLRILFFAMIAGVVIFAGVVVLVLRPQPGESDMTMMLAGLTVLGLALVAAWVVVGRVLRQGLRARLTEASHDEAPGVIHRGFFSIGLVGGAMGEAYCFIALVAHMLTAAPLALLAAAVGLLTLVVQIPTADRFHRFAEEIKGHRPS